jgi:hypothetical protein
MSIVNEDEQSVRKEIEKLTVDLKPYPNAEDLKGQQVNLQTLVNRLNTDCLTIHAKELCYACNTQAHPPLSEIQVEFENEGSEVIAILYIVTPDDDILRFGGMQIVK